MNKTGYIFVCGLCTIATGIIVILGEDAAEMTGNFFIALIFAFLYIGGIASIIYFWKKFETHRELAPQIPSASVSAYKNNNATAMHDSESQDCARDILKELTKSSEGVMNNGNK